MKSRYSKLWGCLAGLLICLAGAAHAQVRFFYTGPYGTAGTWNLYEVVLTPQTWVNADAAARAAAASTTGLSASTQLGRLLDASTQDKNTFAAMIATATPGAGNSNVWLGGNDLVTETGPFSSLPANRSGWLWSGTNGVADALDDDVLDTTEFAAWAPGEPNNSSEEDAMELRADGLWNDLPANNAAQTRRYIIEWQLNESSPIAGATWIPVYYTFPGGAGGTWNLYRISFTACTANSTPLAITQTSWVNAHNEAIAMTADSTGIAAMAGNTTSGHLVAVNGRDEHDFLYRAMLFGSFNSQSTWIGLTDDPAYAAGAAESHFSPTSGWKWAGSSDPYGSGSYHRFTPRPPLSNQNGTARQPDNSNAVEHAVEMLGTGFWNDINGNVPGSNTVLGTVRRYVTEFEINSATAISDPRVGQMNTPFLPPSSERTNVITAVTPSTTQWAIQEIRMSGTPVSNPGNPATAYGIANDTNAVLGTETAVFAASPVFNHSDPIVSVTSTANRGLTGVYFPDRPLIGDIAATDDNNLVVVGRTLIDCLAGRTYTVNVHGDDGFMLRITGATFGTVTGLGLRDPGDHSCIILPYGTGDSNTRGQFTVPADGTYDVEYVGWEGGGGCHYEVSWQEGAYEWDWQTTWNLMGGTLVPGGSPGVDAPLLGAVGSLNVPPPGGAGWSLRSQYQNAGVPVAAGVTNVPGAIANFQAGTGNITDVPDWPVINFIDPNNIGTFRFFTGDTAFPGDTGADDNHYQMGGKYTWNVPAGIYTIGIRCSDVGALRVDGCEWRRVSSAYANGQVDTYDRSTYWWPLTSGDSNMRGVLYVPTGGNHDVEFFFYTTTGNSNAEIYWTPGVALGEIDSNQWRLLGNTAALTPILPAVIAGGLNGGTGTWGIHHVRGAGTISDLNAAIAALQNGAAGVHSFGHSPVINHIEPNYPGPGGIFSNDLTLPGDLVVPPKPGDPVGNDEDFAIHARSRVAISTAGLYSFGFRVSDGFACRISGGGGAVWRAISSGAFSSRPAGIDPADPSTIACPVANNGPVSELTCRALTYLDVGCYDLDFITFDRINDFHCEIYATPGDFVFGPNNHEWFANPTLGSISAPQPGEWRLVGYKAPSSTTGRLGVSAAWTVVQTAPITGTTAPVGWASTIAGAENWLNTQPTTSATRNWINMNDPTNGGGALIPVNQQAIPRDNNGGAAVDDNFYATRFNASVVVPVDGTYHIGWQGDDGGYLEFNLGGSLPAGWTGFTGVKQNAVLNTTTGQGRGIIANSTDGTVNSRIATDQGGGNTRTIGQIFLPAGTYPVQSVWFEGTGGSYWEIMATDSNAAGTFQLIANGGAGVIPDFDGLPLVTQDLEFLSISRTPLGLQSFTWASAPGITYKVMGSNDLASWGLVQMITATGFTTTWTETLGSTRKFYMVEK